MENHILAIRLIEFISSTDFENAKIFRSSLIDILDNTRNQNGQSMDIIKCSYLMDEEDIHVQVQFDEYYTGLKKFIVTISKADLLKHLNFNKEVIKAGVNRELVDVHETFLQLDRVLVNQYIDDICAGRINYKNSTFKSL